MERAVSREPKNPAYRHRLGRIALQTGNRSIAIEQFRKSVDLDPGFIQSWLSLASSLADDGDLIGASEALSTARALHGTPAAVADNVEAKIHLVSGNLEDAQRAIDAALGSSRDGQNLALSIRICIERAERGQVPIGQARARVKALCRELDTLGDLRFAIEYSREFPAYFS